MPTPPDTQAPLPRRLWSNPVAHLIGLLALALGLVVAYGIAHWALRERYEGSIREISKLSFDTYRYQRALDGKRIIVSQSGKPIPGSLDSLPRAPFGLEGLASFQGAIFRHQGNADRLTADYERAKSRVLGSFRDAGLDSRWISVRAVGSENSTFDAQISRSQFDELVGLSLDSFSSRAALAITGGLPRNATNSPAMEITNTGNVLVDRGVARGMLQAARISGGRSGPALPGTVREEIAHHFAQWPSAFAAHILGSTNPPAQHGATTLDDVLGQLSDLLVRDLLSVAQAETGSFWLLGRFRWWEIIFWVWFGVAVMSLIKLLPHLVGADTPSRWEPRESLVAVAKLFYAPILALAVFFLAGQFGLGKIELEELGRSSPSILGVAFILGLFPNTTWRIMQDLCTRLFRDDLKEGAKPKVGGPEPVTVSSNVSVSGGKPIYTVQDLKDNVGNHATSILKPGSN